jgi:hypothetical protein
LIYFLALVPATGLAIAGYFVLYLANRSEGSLRSFGKYLGFWAFTLAGLIVLGSIFAAAHGGHRWPMRGIHDRMHCPWEGGPPPFRGDMPPPGERPRPPGPPASEGAAPAQPPSH